MTPVEVSDKIGQLFTVHEEAGLAEPWTGQKGQVMGQGARDMTLAPCGEPYVTMTSFGIDPPFPDVPAMFGSPAMAHEWLFDEIRFLARELEPDDEKWGDLHFYWRSKPEFHKATYLTMDHAGLMRMASPLAVMSQIELGFSQCMMLLTKTGPDGVER